MHVWKQLYLPDSGGRSVSSGVSGMRAGGVVAGDDEDGGGESSSWDGLGSGSEGASVGPTGDEAEVTSPCGGLPSRSSIIPDACDVNSKARLYIKYVVSNYMQMEWLDLGKEGGDKLYSRRRPMEVQRLIYTICVSLGNRLQNRVWMAHLLHTACTQ